MRNLVGRAWSEAAALGGTRGSIAGAVALGADMEAEDAAGGTPLRQAAGKGQVEAIRALVELGADIDARTDDG